MKIALVLHNNPKADSFFGKKASSCFFSEAVVLPPLGLAYLAAHVRNHGHQVTIVEANVLNMGTPEIIESVKSFAPDMIGYMTHSYYFRETAALVKEVRRHVPVPVVIGGYYLSNVPPETLSFDGIDFAVKGEGEHTLLELMERFSDGAGYSEVKGLLYKDAEGVHVNPDRPAEPDLDVFPFPARDLLPNHLYKTFYSKEMTVTSIITSRGCPHNCYFCVETYMDYRRRSTDSVIEEIRECREKYGIEEFSFYDSTFIVNKKWVHEFCDKLGRSGMKIPWNCRTRVDSIDNETVSRMAAAGCNRISIGVESGTERVSTMINKPMDQEKVREAVRIIKKNRVTAIGFFMMGNPGDDAESMRETVNVAIRHGFDSALFTRLNPWPGSQVYTDFVARTGTDPYADFLRGESDVRDISVCEPYTVEELEGFVYRAYRRFYIRIPFILAQFKNIRDIRTLLAYVKGFFSIVPSLWKRAGS